jgi:hypothetical protein
MALLREVWTGSATAQVKRQADDDREDAEGNEPRDDGAHQCVDIGDEQRPQRTDQEEVDGTDPAAGGPTTPCEVGSLLALLTMPLAMSLVWIPGYGAQPA